jgi:hypothetical protein
MPSLVLLAMLVFQSASAPPPDATVDAILGIQIGTPLADARRILAPLGRSDTRESPASVKEVWRLEGTGFDWIALRANAKGQVVWITGHRRPGREIPFDAIGTAPGVATESIAIWHVNGAHRSERLTLRGANRRAQVVTLLEVEGGQSP